MSIERFHRAFVCSSVTDKASLMAAFRHAYDFGDHFGNNWDALSDSLVEKTFPGQSTLIVLLETSLSEEMCDMLCDIIDDLNNTIRGQHTQLLVVGADPSEPGELP